MAEFIKAIAGPCIDWGIGKAVSAGTSPNKVWVQYFDTPIDTPTRVEVLKSELKRHTLPSQTRIYWQDPSNGTWMVGRVLSHEDGEIEAQFPNGNLQILPADEIHVRWSRPLVDPSPFLSNHINETPMFAEARSSFVASLVRQRAASQGMSALLSAAIELENHQIEVVRRVLLDAEQRYLLADEVGLGKTIEAGVLIRQYVLDSPSHHPVLVLVPPALVEQWREELEQRLLLSQQLNNEESLLVVANTVDPDRLAELLPHIGMLVIDEAHHLSHNQPLYQVIAAATAEVPRLLLLSATPVLHNERSFLQMLHLLDPMLYRLDDEAGFRRRIEHRQFLAETVAGLMPENLLAMDGFLDELQEQFTDDALLQTLTNELRAIIDEFPDEQDPVFIAALHRLRSHLSETYRLDRRILRNRRQAVPWLTPKRAGLQTIDYRCSLRTAVTDTLIDLGEQQAVACYGREDEQAGQNRADWYAAAIDNVLSDLTALRKQAQERLNDRVDNEEAAVLQRLLTTTEQLGNDRQRCTALADWLAAHIDSQTHYVIFCNSAETADTVTTMLRARLATPIDRHQSDPETWRAFLQDPHHYILVCDHRAEEGLNLQGGNKCIIHYDLPLAPNRIEQRLGRVDRYGSGGAIQSLALQCIDIPLECEWLTLLNEGLGVFNRSIASLQFLIEDRVSGLTQRLLFEGIEQIPRLTETLGGKQGEVSAELRRINQQDALDALAAPEEESFEALDEFEMDWQRLATDCDRWLIDTLLLGKFDQAPILGTPPGRVFRLAWRFSPHGGRNTLLPLPLDDRSFLEHFDSEAQGFTVRNLLTHPYSYHRNATLKRAARRHHARPLRIGDPVLDKLVAAMQADDRGRSFALWRQLPGFYCDEPAAVYLRFDFIVEANTRPALDCYRHAGPIAADTAEAALHRRGDQAFPPFVSSIWLDENLEPVTDQELLETLCRPYQRKPLVADQDAGYRDWNLNPQRWQLLWQKSLPILHIWPQLVADARSRAEQELVRRSDLELRCRDALDRTRLKDETHFAQFRTRIQRSDPLDAQPLQQRLELETKVATALYDGIKVPRVSLDSIGAVFLSPQAIDDGES